MADSAVKLPSIGLGSGSPHSPDLGAMDFSSLPLTFVLSTHISTEDLHSIEDTLIRGNAPLTYDPKEARLFLGKLASKKRAQFELRSRKVWTKEVPQEHGQGGGWKRERKRRKLSSGSPEPKEYADLDTSAEESADVAGDKRESSSPVPSYFEDDTVKVVKLQWMNDSLSSGNIAPFPPYVIYEGIHTTSPSNPISPTRSSKAKSPSSPRPVSPSTQARDIIARARADTPPKHSYSQARFLSAPHGRRRFAKQAQHARDPAPKKILLPFHESTEGEEVRHSSEGEGEGESAIPPPPDWVRQGLKYACQRRALADGPNERFLATLRKIKLARVLTGDDVGVRAYGTAIAAIAALPAKLRHPKEILRLPGCDVKIANLWIEWERNGLVRAAQEVDEDPTLVTLQRFYAIWGVGATTAREWVFKRGWQYVDDVVEDGWDELSRVQQIGVKFCQEFHLGIPRAEVSRIVDTVRRHAVRVRDEGVRVLPVGGYRRGKDESGDVDIMVSHRNLEATKDLVTDLVVSLEEEGFVTHTLTLALTGTKRGQAVLQFRAPGSHVPGSGFDTLDKALLVWQEPEWEERGEKGGKNPNPHRRVDIIVSPWRTVGCAVLGWSGGTTFQRDLRRYAKYEKGWKFDSSGIRERRSGKVVPLEGVEGVDGDDMVEAERSVFEGLGLVYREPWERWTD